MSSYIYKNVAYIKKARIGVDNTRVTNTNVALIVKNIVDAFFFLKVKMPQIRVIKLVSAVIPTTNISIYKK